VPKIHWESVPSVSQAERDSNAVIIKTLGLADHRGSGRLAVVGGGPSIARHADELRSWDGEIWAVNGAVNWCIDHGIDAAFYTADAAEAHRWPYDLSRIRRAVLAPDCSPSLVNYLLARGATVTLTTPIQSGPTSANASDFLSLKAGYRHVTYFGCEGSFDYLDLAATHAHAAHPIEDWMVVELGGERYRTKAEFISQSIMLANILREFPDTYSEKSGGLLRAMIEHGPEFEVYMVSNSLYAKLKDAA
jgi:hypothetical protein